MASTTTALEFVIRANDDNFRASVRRMGTDFQRGVQGMAQAANTQAKKINQALSGVQAFGKMQADIGKAESALRDLKTESDRLGASYRRAMEMGSDPEALRFQKELKRDYVNSNAAVKKLSASLDRQRASMTQLGDSLREAGVDTARLGENQERLQREMHAATKEVQEQSRATRAFATLGVRSFRDVEDEVQRLENAYRELALSGRASASDLNRAHQQMQRRTRELRGEMNGLDRSMGGLGASVRNLIAIYAGFESIRAASGFIKDSILTYAKFDDVMRQVGATSGATREELKGLTELAKKMGETTRFSASQSAEGLKAMSLAGLSAAQQMQALPKVLELAAAGSVDLETAAGIATAAMAQFGLEARDLAEVNDILVTAFTNSATDIQGLGLALQYAGPVAKAAGNSFQETATVLAILAKNGFAGEKAGTALRGAYARLLNPVDKAADAIARLKLKTKDASGALLPMTQIMRNLKASGADAAAMIEIFGVEAAPALMSAVGMTSKAFEELIRKFDKTSGTAARVAKEMEDGLGGSLRSLESAWEGVKIAVGEAIDQHESIDLKELVRAINENKDSIIEMALAGVDLGVMLAKVGIAVGQFLLEWKDVIAVLGTAAIAMKTVSTIFKVFTAIGAAQWFIGTTAAVKTFTAAVGAQGLAGALGLARTRMMALLAINMSAFSSAGLIATGVMAGLATATVVAVGALASLGYQWWQVKKAEEAAAESTRAATEVQGRLAARLKEVSNQLGITIPNMETFNRLQQEGAIAPKEDGTGWQLASHEKLIALLERERLLTREGLQEKISASQQVVQARQQEIAESIRLQTEYASRMRELATELARMQMSDEDRIRDLQRRGMTEKAAEQDRTRQAYEKIRLAKELAASADQAFSKGDEVAAAGFAKEAKEVAEQAKSMASNLKDSKTAISAFQEAAKASTQAQQAMIDGNNRQMEAEKARTQSLQEQMAAQMTAISTYQAALAAIPEGKDTKVHADTVAALESVKGVVDALAAIPASKDTKVNVDTMVAMVNGRDIRAELDAIPANKDTTVNLDTMQAIVNGRDLSAVIASLRDKTVTVTFRREEAHAAGGWAGSLARMREGGRLPGYGGGDRIRALLEAGEFVVKKDRARTFSGLLEAINSAPMDTLRRLLPEMPRFQDGGLVGALQIPAIPSLAMAGGGQVTSPPVEGVVRLDLTMNGEPAASITSPRQQVRQLVDALTELKRGAR